VAVAQAPDDDGIFQVRVKVAQHEERAVLVFDQQVERLDGIAQIRELLVAGEALGDGPVEQLALDRALGVEGVPRGRDGPFDALFLGAVDVDDGVAGLDEMLELGPAIDALRHERFSLRIRGAAEPHGTGAGSS
jgi:hypothetical protein